MILIIGGAYQGKLDYVLDAYQIPQEEVHNCSEDNTKLSGRRVIYHFEKWVMACLDQGKEAVKEMREYLQVHPESIIICEDISSGVVPVDPRLRQWRENVGRHVTVLSREADEVVRLFCGIPTKLK